MTLKNDEISEEELTCRFKIDIRNFTNLMLLTKVYDVWAKKLQRDYVWWHWRLMPNLKENWLVLSKMTFRIWEIFVYRLKNSDFILESKMAELNHNKNSKKPGRRDAVWKLHFTLEINE